MLTIMPKLKIDRLRITGIGLHKEHYGITKMQFSEIAALSKSVIKEGYVDYHQDSDFRHRIKYSLDKNHPIVQIESGSTKSKVRYLAWELWPHNIKLEQFQKFHEFTQILLQEPIFRYDTAFFHGKVQYIEFATGIYQRSMSEFIPWRDRVAKSDVWKSNDAKGTIYIGSPASALSFAIYDKSKQLMEKGLPPGKITHTRIESKMRKTKAHICDLPLMKNPFASLKIADLLAVQQKLPHKFTHFLDLAPNLGAPAALMTFSDKQRKVIRTILNECNCAWWNPESVWSNASDAIVKLIPKNLGL